MIEFVIGVDMTQEFMKAVSEVPESKWFRLNRTVDGKLQETNQEYAEVCFVPDWMGQIRKDRYIGIWPLVPLGEKKGAKKTEETAESELPFPTMEMNRVKYKITGLVTNGNLPAEELIWLYGGRCGKSEEAHSIMKQDLAGGQFPSALFGANAAWWHILIMSPNFQAAMQRLVPGRTWTSRRLKVISFWLINVPGPVFERSRVLAVRLARGIPRTKYF